MNLSNEYIAPQEAAEAVYSHARGKYLHAFTDLLLTSSSRSYDKNGKSRICTQHCTVELTTKEPYQIYVLHIDVELRGKDGQVHIHSAGIDSINVFPSDTDTLELWMTQFKCFMRREFEKDKDNA